MPAAQTEVARLVAVIMAQNDQFMKAFAEQNAALEQFKKKAGETSETAITEFSRTSMSLRDTRHALHLLAASEVIPHQGVGQLMLFVHGYHLAHKGVQTLVASLTTLRGALMATGIGAAVVGAIVLYNWLAKLSKVHEEIQEGASKAFHEWVTGAKNVAETMRELKIESLTESSKELGDKIQALANLTLQEKGLDPEALWKPGAWQFKAAQEELDEFQKAVFEKARLTAEIVKEMMKSPEGQEMRLEMLTEKTSAAIEKSAEGFKAEAMLVHESAEQKKILAAAAHYAAEENITLAQAIEQFKEQIDKAEGALFGLALGAATEETRKLTDETEKARIEFEQGAAAAEEFQMKREFARKTKTDLVPPELQGQIDAMKKFKAESAQISAEKFIRDMDRRTVAQRVGTDEAERLKMVEDLKRGAVDLATQAIVQNSLAMAQAKRASQELADMTNKYTEELDKAIISATEGTDAAERYGLVIKYAKEHSISFEEALRRMGPTLDNIKEKQDDLAMLKIFEQTMTPFEKFQKRMDEINKLFNYGAKYPQLYARAVQEAEKALNAGADAGEKFQATGFFSAEAQTRMEEFHDRMVSPVPLGMAVRGAAPGAFGAEGMQQTNGLLSDMLRLQQERLKPQALQPASLGAGFVAASGGGFFH
jgi:hypothetical protein